MSHLSKRLGADSGRDRASGTSRPARGAEHAAAERSGAALIYVWRISAMRLGETASVRQVSSVG
jgi:hypothetical protein